MEERAGQSGPPPGKLHVHQVDLIFRELEGLPTLAAIAARVLELTSRCAGEGAEAQDALGRAAGIIAADPPMAARVLSLANASSSRPVATVGEAVECLGAEGVRAAVLGTKTLDRWPSRAGQDDGLEARGFWRHCLAVAAAAKALVERGALPLDPEEAFAAGLLHDIGKLALAVVLPKSHARAVAAARLHHGALGDYEKQILGVDHPVVGRRLAQRWRLPDSLASVIWLHHLPGEAIPPSVAAAPLVRVVALADAVAHSRRVGVSGSFSAAHRPQALLGRLGVSEQVVAEVGDRLAAEVERHARLLGLDGPTGADSPDSALGGAVRELGRLNEQLRRRGQVLSAHAKALGHFSTFAEALGPEMEVADVLARMAQAVLAAGASDGAGAAAYSLEAESGQVIAVRCSRGHEPQWRVFPPADGAEGWGCPEAPGSAGEVLAGLLGGGGTWQEWADIAGWRHQPLRCGGRWVGGLLYPPGRPDEVRDLLAAGLGMALGLVQQRCRAQRLCEELAGASRELAEAQEALAEAKALAAVGDLAAGAAHELNNPLAVVSGRAQLMRGRSRSDKQRQTWQTIAEQAQRISDIISDLMDFANPPQPAPTDIEPRELLAKAAEAFSTSDHPKAGMSQVDIDIGEDCPAVRADRAQIHAVILELIANAATAAESTPHIRLAAQSDELTGAVVLTVRDNGPGMDGATVARACTPFFSAQAAGRRRGLGLARAKRYVENNGGRIWIDSRPGLGTAVCIQLPGARGSPSVREQDHAQE